MYVCIPLIYPFWIVCLLLSIKCPVKYVICGLKIDYSLRKFNAPIKNSLYCIPVIHQVF